MASYRFSCVHLCARYHHQASAASVLEPPPAFFDDPACDATRSVRDLTLLEANACGLVTDAQIRTLQQCHGTPEHDVQRTRILEIAQQHYAEQVLRWPRCAPGPLLAGPHGLLIPMELRGRTYAQRVRVQLEQTAALRELVRHERQALRVLKANGIRVAVDAADEAALDRARLKRLSKAAKRARAAQAGCASARARAVAASSAQEVAC